MPRTSDGKRTLWTPQMVEMIRTRYPEEGPDLLAEEFRVSPRTIVNYVYKKGLGVRVSRKGSYMKEVYRKRSQTVFARYKGCDVSYFDTWTPHSAYILGYTWADGSVRSVEKGRSAPRAVAYCCVTTDKEILLFIKEQLKARAKLINRPARRFFSRVSGKEYTAKPVTDLVICSTRLAEKLVSEHGIEPRKSHKDLSFPSNVPVGLLSHFIRGYLDGDGYVSQPEKTCQVRLYGTADFLTGIRDKLVSHAGVQEVSLRVVKPRKGRKSNPYFRELIWSNPRDIHKLFNYLYPTGEDYFRLERKWRRFQRLLLTYPND